MPSPGRRSIRLLATLVPDDPARFAGDAFHAHVLADLPPYAVPAILRLQEQENLTATFELRNVQLQREGWDLARIDDPLFVHDDGARAFVPLTPERHAAIRAGTWRL